MSIAALVLWSLLTIAVSALAEAAAKAAEMPRLAYGVNFASGMVIGVLLAIFLQLGSA